MATANNGNNKVNMFRLKNPSEYKKCPPPTTHSKMLVEKDGEVIGNCKRVVVKNVSWALEDPSYEPFSNDRPSFIGPIEKRPDYADNLDYTMIDFTKRPECRNMLFFPNGCPKNPCGRTGSGKESRGFLGHWGVNRAGDPLVTTFRKDKNGIFELRNGLPIMDFIGILRKDDGRGDDPKALPGGMIEIQKKKLPDGTLVNVKILAPNGDEIDCYEDTVSAIVREFFEEAMADMKGDEKVRAVEEITSIMKNEAYVLYGVDESSTDIMDGYVDDPRNGDNAWMSSLVKAWHDKSGIIFEKYKNRLVGGDDAKKALIFSYHPDDDATFKMFASHAEWVKFHYRNLVEIL